MSTYTDGFVLCIPRNHLEAYIQLALLAGKIWREHGALEYRECAADDMEAKDMVSFPELTKAGPDEIVIFAFAVFKSREHRDAANIKIMSDPRLTQICEAGGGGVIEYNRMAYGGFQTIVDL